MPPFDDVRPPGHPHSDVPAVDGAAVVLDAAISPPSRGIWIGGAGNLDVTWVSGSRTTITGVPAGIYLPIAVKIVHATATTATDLQVWR